jgi:hypothetical protein
MLGVVSGSLQPKAPIESALMSSTVINRRLGLSAAPTEQGLSKGEKSRIQKNRVM